MYRQTIIRRNGGTFRSVAKNDKVEAYQTMVTYLVKLSKPKGWEASGQIRLYYDFVLKREVDADNMLKALNDAIAMALGVNDRVFLPCVRSKTVDGSIKDPHVVVQVQEA